MGAGSRTTFRPVILFGHERLDRAVTLCHKVNMNTASAAATFIPEKMKARMGVKRWLWIPAMAPVMWVLWRFVVSADRLYAWHYSEGYAPPTPADYTYAAIAFWTALLTPALVGSVTAFIAFRRKYRADWPFLELTIVVIPWLTGVTGELTHALYSSQWVGTALWQIISRASLLVGGAVVISCLNIGACVSRRKWGRLALSALVFCAGMLYLLWLNAFIIYLDT